MSKAFAVRVGGGVVGVGSFVVVLVAFFVSYYKDVPASYVIQVLTFQISPSGK